MDLKEIGINKFKEGYNCAQSVLFSLREYTGLTEDQSLKIATGFGSGMGRTQNICGAVSGGILALNMICGRGCEDEKPQQEVNYLKIRELISNFEEKNNTIICRKLLDGCNLLSDEGQQRFKSENMVEQCHGYIADAIGIVDGIIE